MKIANLQFVKLSFELFAKYSLQSFLLFYTLFNDVFTISSALHKMLFMRCNQKICSSAFNSSVTTLFSAILFTVRNYSAFACSSTSCRYAFSFLVVNKLTNRNFCSAQCRHEIVCLSSHWNTTWIREIQIVKDHWMTDKHSVLSENLGLWICTKWVQKKCL